MKHNAMTAITAWLEKGAALIIMCICTYHASNISIAGFASRKLGSPCLQSCIFIRVTIHRKNSVRKDLCHFFDLWQTQGQTGTKSFWNRKVHPAFGIVGPYVCLSFATPSTSTIAAAHQYGVAFWGKHRCIQDGVLLCAAAHLSFILPSS